MIVARYFLRDAIERRFPDVVARVNRGIAPDGARYLFALRLVPLSHPSSSIWRWA
ncbi:hypothetical protein [Mesorhizobium captivum]|uniref:hypothetical protein n=1 Tax=Mesorhizobium captivum TaxID=3072319 RepID=UPI003D31F2CB